MSNERQSYYEGERLLEVRCPRCGSRDVYPADESYNDETHDVVEFGTNCRDCGYWYDYFGNPPTTPPFIMPGDPGSHDQLTDYDPMPVTTP